MDFRKDINGLRALAVFPVIFFHSGWQLFSGGFLGVDVFFVISGYLITSIILRDLMRGTFSILDFYDKRIRRIFPALLLVMTISSIISIFLMLPYDLRIFGQSVFATAFSANNILLYLTSGYWSLASEFKPLYHTWSLGVEEQYYLIVPLVMISCVRLSKQHHRSVLIVFITIFILSILLAAKTNDSEFNFLIILTRMWELTAGAICAVGMQRKDIKSNPILGTIGLLTILLSYVFPYIVSENQAIFCLVPVIGTCLVIVYSHDSNIVGKILSLKPLFHIGTISYSVYLFHLPFLAFLRLASETTPSVPLQLFFSLLAVPIGYISWKYIEVPARHSKLLGKRKYYILICIMFLLLTSFGLILHKSFGLQKHYPEYDYGTNPQVYTDRRKDLQNTEFTTDQRDKMLIIGNSFARDFINMLEENSVLDFYDVVYLPKLNYENTSTKSLLSKSDVTISVSSFGMESKLDSEVARMRSIKIRNYLKSQTSNDIYRIGTKNFGWNNNFIRMRKPEQRLDYRVLPNQTSSEANLIERKIWGDDYIDILGALSNESGEIRMFTPDGKFISFDTEHVTQSGAQYIGEILLIETSLSQLTRNSD